MNSQPEFEQRYAAACEQLTEAVERGRHAYHLITAACVNSDGGPELRTVVLRGFDAARRRILFHTDRRSPKVRWLGENSAISLLFYDRESKQQLRFYARATVHIDDALAQAQWADTRANSKLCYLAEHGSGHEVLLPEACGMDGRRGPVEPGDEDIAAYGNFAVIASFYDRLDLVQLDYRGHERCELNWDGAGMMTGRWLAI